MCHQPHIVQAIEVVMGSYRQDPPWLILEWIDVDLRSIILDL